MRTECDVLIVGGGLVGSTLAHALAQIPVATVLVEERAPGLLVVEKDGNGRLDAPGLAESPESPGSLGSPRSPAPSGFDRRSTALSSGSQRILEGLGLWDDIAAAAEPILTIHISERGRFGASRIHASREGVPAVGYTVENRVLARAVWPKILGAERQAGRGDEAWSEGMAARKTVAETRADAKTEAKSEAGDDGKANTVTCMAPGRLEDFETDATGVTARVRTGGSTQTVRARLLVAADGARSPVRGALGIGAREDDYDQTGVILNCETEIPHRGQAFERFTPTGPLAMLPLARERVSVVWTLSREEGERIGALDDAPFRDALQRAFGHRLGRIRRVGARSAWPLRRIRAETLTASRSVLIGNAAFSLHPVAGQGFNLALRDIAALAELICDARLRGLDGLDGLNSDPDAGLHGNARGAPAPAPVADTDHRLGAGHDARSVSGADPGSAALLDRYAQWRAADQRRVSGFTHGLMRLFTIDAAPLAASRGPWPHGVRPDAGRQALAGPAGDGARWAGVAPGAGIAARAVSASARSPPAP